MNLFNFNFRSITPKTQVKNGLKAFLFFFIGLGLTFLATNYVIRTLQDDENSEFEYICKEIKTKISLRLHCHAQLLRSSSAFFAGSVSVTRSEWKAFNERERIIINLPGIQGVGFSLIIPKNKLQEHVRSMRKEGFPEYTVKPAGVRDIYTSIIYLEPFSGRNLLAFGFDMYSEPIRRKAMEYACDSDIASLSGKVILVQETNSDVQAGTLMYVPVYNNGVPILTVAQRRSAILGWVYSPYRMRDLMHGILGRWDSLTNNRIRMQVFDDSISYRSLLFDSQHNKTVQQMTKHRHALELPVEFNGTKWILYFTQSVNHGLFSDWPVLLVISSGIMISLLIFFLLFELMTTHQRALQIAEKLSKDLKESEERFKKMFELHTSVMLLVDPENGNIVDANTAASDFYGFSVNELCRKSITGINTLPPDQTIMAFKKAVDMIQNNFIFKHRSATNEIRDVEVHSAPVEISGKAFLFSIIYDITDRKKIEEALRESEERYRTLFEITGTSIVILDEDMTISLANEQFARSTGFKRTEIEGVKKWTEFIDIKDVEIMIAQHKLRREMPSQALTNYEFQYWTNSGELRTALINAQLIPGTRKSIASLFDITDRKNAEAKIALMRANYEIFFNSIDDLLFVLDEQGNIIHTNSLVIKRLGYTLEELIGKSVLTVYPPERWEEAYRIVGEILTGLTEFCPFPVITKSGIQIPVETRFTKSYWNEKPVIVGIIKDISQLKLSEEKFSKLFYLNPSPCGLSDLENNSYVEVNDGFYTLFGFTPAEVIGKTALDLGIMTSETAHSVLLKADSNGKIVNVEADLTAKNGEIKKVMMSAENIYIQDKKYRFIVAVDITDRVRYEQEIVRKNEELSLANAEKDRFFSIIAHDLRSPFNSLLGFSKMLVEELPTLTSENIEKIAVNLSRSADKLYKLLENLLEWSKMQQGLVRFNPEPILLLKHIDSGIEIVREAAIMKKIDISIDAPLDMAIIADIHMFESLMHNLVFNAVKFTPKGGSITISAKPVSNEMVELSITDTGVGMDEKMIKKLFSLVEDTGRKGTEDEPSTGLGLILCKEFVEKNNGKIGVRSKVGSGSTFYFTLPSCKEIKSNNISSIVHPSAPEAFQMKKLKILIAEDDEISLALLLIDISKISSEVLQATTGIEAVETCQKHKDIDLILMDIQLPWINGYEAVCQIRRFNKEVIIIAQTAYGFPEARAKAIEAGCDDYIEKPIDKNLLLALIRKHFNKK